MRLTRIGVVSFVLAVGCAPAYAPADYDWVRNLISELAAQGAPKAWLMSSAFIVLGLTVTIDAWRQHSFAAIPFCIFGVCFALAGVFQHRPLDPALVYDGRAHALHGLLATLSGIALSAGLAWHAVIQKQHIRKAVAGALALLGLLLPLAMLLWPAQQGAIQRVMYVLVFAWLWASPHNNNSQQTVKHTIPRTLRSKNS